MAGRPDELSFDEAFPALIAKAFRLAQRMLADRALAEDVAADALAITLVRWHRVADLPYRDAWVLRVTANLALRAAKHRGRAVPALAGVGETPRSFEHDAALRLALTDALRRLPRRQREAVALRYLSGLSEREVAGILGVSPGSVKTHVHRGIRSLRQTLGMTFEEVDVAFAD